VGLVRYVQRHTDQGWVPVSSGSLASSSRAARAMKPLQMVVLCRQNAVDWRPCIDSAGDIEPVLYSWSLAIPPCIVDAVLRNQTVPRPAQQVLCGERLWVFARFVLRDSRWLSRTILRRNAPVFHLDHADRHPVVNAPGRCLMGLAELFGSFRYSRSGAFCRSWPQVFRHQIGGWPLRRGPRWPVTLAVPFNPRRQRQARTQSFPAVTLFGRHGPPANSAR